MRAPRLPVPSDRALRWLKWTVAAAIVIALVASIAALSSFAQRLDTYAFELERADRQRAAIEATNESQADAILDQQRALREANERCRDATGCTPVPTPAVVVPGPAGNRGDTGPAGKRGPGPSAAQVAVAVESYCASGVCTGPGPTPDQVAAAVVRFCDRNGQCRGPVGPAGADGESITGPAGADGKDGKDGDRGPGPTAEQVAAAVAEYCEGGRCDGAPGADSTVPGPAGATGPPGRGIEALSCDSATPLSLTVTYSDGTNATYQCGPSAPVE